MPIENNFHHDEMSRKNPGERLSYSELATTASPETPAWNETMGALGSRLAQAGVRLVLFFHGSILGTDVFGLQRLDEAGGLKRGYSRGISGLDSLLAFMREGDNGIPPLPGGLKPPLANDEATKTLVDQQIGDAQGSLERLGKDLGSHLIPGRHAAIGSTPGRRQRIARGPGRSAVVCHQPPRRRGTANDACQSQSVLPTDMLNRL